jgi:hypothetical protein
MSQAWKNALATVKWPDGSYDIPHPTMHEIGSADFHRLISDAVKSLGKDGITVHVYSPEEYANMRTVIVDDGTAGFAVKPDGDIVSVFRHIDSQYRGITPSMMQLAVDLGGKKLDAFDTKTTNLPVLYGRSGFREVARLPFDIDKAPDGWDVATMGTPDIVFMVHDPSFNGMSTKIAPYADSYEHALELQNDALKSHPSPTLFQRSTKGIKALYDRVTNQITLIKGRADISSAIHENGHALKEILLKSDKAGLIRKLYGNSADVKGHERFARHLENYFRTGDAPNPEVAQIFESIKTWMRDIYAKGFGGKIDPQVKAIFDEVYGKSDAETDAFLKQLGSKKSATVQSDGTTQKAARGSFNKEQIQIAPIKGADPTTIVNPMVALNRLLGKRLLQGKQAKRIRRAAGYYKPWTGETTVASVNNLATAAHEISHALDDRYKLGKNLIFIEADGSLTPYGHELNWFKERGGSGNPTIQNDYDVEEARAEFFKSYLFNPDAARAQAPKYAAYFEKAVDPAVMKEIRAASDAIRKWGGLTAAGKTQAQIRTAAPEKGKRDSISPEDYKTSRRAEIEKAFTDELAPIRDAVDEAIKRGGRAPSKPTEDPIELLRAFGYIGNKVDTILAEGMIRFHTADKVAGFTKGGFSRILEPLIRTSNKAFEVDLSRAEAYITAQSVVEDWETRWKATVDAQLNQIHAEMLAENPDMTPGDWQRWLNDPENQAQIRAITRAAKKAASSEMQDYTGTSKMMGNDIVDARRTIREIERNPKDLARYRRFALRYRQWSKAVIQYMVDAGRLSPSQGAAIMQRSKYAAINRVFDEGPGETFRVGGVTRGKNPIKGRTGSTRQIESPVKNLIMQTAKAVAEAELVVDGREAEA